MYCLVLEPLLRSPVGMKKDVTQAALPALLGHAIGILMFVDFDAESPLIREHFTPAHAHRQTKAMRDNEGYYRDLQHYCVAGTQVVAFAPKT